jgi:hypothetical protein
VAVVAGAALRASLGAVLAFILVARAAHWKATFMAGRKELPFRSHAHVVTADLADVAVHIAQRLCTLHHNTRTQRMAMASVDRTPPTLKFLHQRTSLLS